MTSHTPSPLPERPNLEHLRKLAKSLLHAARAGDAGALERFRLLPAFAGKSVAELRDAGLALHDAQSAIAREHGFQSWNALREHVEERSLSFAAAVDEFVRCAAGSAAARAQRLLALHPGIAHASLQAELVLGDLEAVRARLRSEPALATQPGGIQNWEPLLYVCHTCLHRDEPTRAANFAAIATELLERGANPNAEYRWQWHPELPRTALWGALCATSHLPLAEVLLQRGANPTDGVTTHITAGSDNIEALELLHRYGMNPNGIPGGVPPLRYILSWADKTVGVQWLLEHGADPNLSWNEHGDAPIHVAAQRWDVSLMELLARHGADLHQRRRDGRTALTIAELQGNAPVAAWLRAHGANDELSLLERFVAACTSGDRPRADAMLRSNPELRSQLRPEHHLTMQVPAERGDAAVLEVMMTCGFDPNARDHDGVTALHRASMAGRVDAVRALIAHGAALDPLDGMFAAPPLVWAAEGRGHTSRTGADYLGVARLLMAAGSPTTWTPPEKAPDPEATQEALLELCRAAGATENAKSL
jgi:ankyrin repeat protein